MSFRSEVRAKLAAINVRLDAQSKDLTELRGIAIGSERWRDAMLQQYAELRKDVETVRQMVLSKHAELCEILKNIPLLESVAAQNSSILSAVRNGKAKARNGKR